MKGDKDQQLTTSRGLGLGFSLAIRTFARSLQESATGQPGRTTPVSPRNAQTNLQQMQKIG